MVKKVGWVRYQGLELQTKKLRPDSIDSWQLLKGFKQKVLGRCKSGIGNRKISQKTLLLSEIIWQQSKEGEMGALTRDGKKGGNR